MTSRIFVPMGTMTFCGFCTALPSTVTRFIVSGMPVRM